MTKTALELAGIRAQDHRHKQEMDQREKERQTKEHIAGEQVKAQYITGLVGSALRPFRVSANDIKWYWALNPATIDSVVSVPTWLNPGQPLKYDIGQVGSGTLLGKIYPTVYSARFIPTYGYCEYVADAAQDDLNYAYARMQANMRSLNSRIGQYEPGDLGQVQVGTLELACAIEAMKRALALSNHYVKDNAWFAETFIEACGFNAKDTQVNWKSYKKRLNFLIEKFNNNLVLLDCGLVQRRLLMNSLIFVDTHGWAGQYLIPVQVVYGKYIESSATVTFNTGPIVDPNGPILMSALLTYCETIINELIYSTVLTDMYADLRGALKSNENKAFFQVVLDYFEGDGKICLTDDAMIGDQIRNCSTLAPTSTAYGMGGIYSIAALYRESLTVHQNTSGFLYQGATENLLISSGSNYKVVRGAFQTYQSSSAISTNEAKMALYGRASYYKRNTYLNLDEENASNAGITEGTRLRAIFDGIYGTSSGDPSIYVGYLFVRECGSEALLDIMAFTCPSGLNSSYPRVHVLSGPYGINDGISDWAVKLYCSTAFGYNPIYTFSNASGPGYGTSFTDWSANVATPSNYHDVYNWHYPVALNADDLRTIHHMCTQSLLVYGNTPKAYFNGMVDKVYKKRTAKQTNKDKVEPPAQ